MKNKANRAHYRLDTSIGHKRWKPTRKVLCIFHARRISRDGYRLTGLRAGNNGMTRPVELYCTECLQRRERCEHDMQNCICPRIVGDTCGRDSDKELGGSW